MAYIERGCSDTRHWMDEWFYHVHEIVIGLFTKYLHRVWTLYRVAHDGLDVGLIRRTWEALLDVGEHARSGHQCRIRGDVSEPVQTGAEVRVCGRHLPF